MRGDEKGEREKKEGERGVKGLAQHIAKRGIFEHAIFAINFSFLDTSDPHTLKRDFNLSTMPAPSPSIVIH